MQDTSEMCFLVFNRVVHGIYFALEMCPCKECGVSDE